MKELTIEQKAKAYDEALSKAKEQYNYPCMRSCMGILEEIFPELKESEDEKMRKEIIDFLKLPHPQFVGKRDHEKWITWLEKQAEQKPILDFKAKDWYVSKVDGKIHNIYHSVDKVEPKFKVGEWLIFSDNHNSIYQVERIDNYRYYLRHYLGGTLSVHFDNELIRKWTIQDAKDGDVLTTKAGSIFIYKELLYDKPFAYCGVDKFGVFKDCNCGNGLDWTPYLSNVTPAAKEQRDTLLKAMADAGYTFDFEKKELLVKA